MNPNPKTHRKASVTRRGVPAPDPSVEAPSPRSMHEVKRNILRKIAARLGGKTCPCVEISLEIHSESEHTR